MKFDTASMLQGTYNSPLGRIRLAASALGLAGLWFEGQRHMPWQVFAPLQASGKAPVSAAWPQAPDSHALLQQTCRWLDAYFADEATADLPPLFHLPLDLSGGTAFQQAVWQALLLIPASSTASYAAISQSIGKPSAVRAVGAAIGRNPISILVPCHRVVASGNGALTGYAGGLERKAALLALEGVVLPSLPGSTAVRRLAPSSADNRFLSRHLPGIPEALPI